LSISEKLPACIDEYFIKPFTFITRANTTNLASDLFSVLFQTVPIYCFAFLFKLSFDKIMRHRFYLQCRIFQNVFSNKCYTKACFQSMQFYSTRYNLSWYHFNIRISYIL